MYAVTCLASRTAAVQCSTLTYMYRYVLEMIVLDSYYRLFYQQNCCSNRQVPTKTLLSERAHRAKGIPGGRQVRVEEGWFMGLFTNCAFNSLHEWVVAFLLK